MINFSNKIINFHVTEVIHTSLLLWAYVGIIAVFIIQ